MSVYKRIKELFWYSDSEPNELLIAMCHLVCLPISICTEYEHPNYYLIIVAIGVGLFQAYAVVISQTLQHRLIAVKIASVVGIATVMNLSMVGLMEGSRTGWIIILAFALWNVIRVQREKIIRNG